MPCYDPRDSIEYVDNPETKRMLNKVEAMLCATFSVLEKRIRNNEGATGLTSVLDDIDYKEAGVSRKQIEQWWRVHKAADKLRRVTEKTVQRRL